MRQSDLIFPAGLAFKALSAGAYKNSAYALAEVVDNSYEARAKDIHVCLFADEEKSSPKMVAVLDNGVGMDREQLKHSVQYGHGRRRSVEDKNLKLGKFGVGLLQATLSQCSCLEVMSWQGGVVNGAVPYIKVEYVDGEDHLTDGDGLPEPQQKAIPDVLLNAFSAFSGGSLESLDSGTIVVWKSITRERISWKKSSTLATHLAEECGRIYRNFIRGGDYEKMRIAVSIHDDDGEKINAKEYPVLPRDPSFLHHWEDPSLAGFKGKGRTLFKMHTRTENDEGQNQDGSYKPTTFQHARDSAKWVNILPSYRRPGIVQEVYGNDVDPGSTPCGKLAAALRGVSILRAGREIMLDSGWLRDDKTIDRWVSVSVDFHPSLDDVFGVSNNKQDAQKLSMLAGEAIQDLQAMLSELEDDETLDEDAILRHKVAIAVKRNLLEMQTKVKQERANFRRKKHDDLPDSNRQVDPYDPSSASTDELIRLTESNEQDITPANDITLEAGYRESTLGDQLASAVRPSTIRQYGLKFDIVTDPAAGDSAFFHGVVAANTLIVHLNKSHAIYEHLKQMKINYVDGRAPDADDEYEAELEKMSIADKLAKQEEQLEGFRKTIRSLIVAFALAEHKSKAASDDDEAHAFEDCRLAWSRVAQKIFLYGNASSDDI